MRKKRLLRWVAVAVLVVGLMVFISEFHIIARLRFAINEWRYAEQWKHRSLWLPDYRLALKKEVAGIDRNLSGLTWNSDSQTLFAVINRPPEIVELSRDGTLLRRIRLRGFKDTEAVEYIGGNRFVIAEENAQRLSLTIIGPDTSEIRREGLPQSTVGMGKAGNSGLEGLAWDSTREKLYVAKERRPVHIYEVSGFPQDPAELNIEVSSNPERDTQLFVNDLSGLDFDQEYNHLLVLSDASKLLIEVDTDGQPVSSLSLIVGNGLHAPVPQAEGVALDDEKNLYLVSEPNLFYVYRKSSETTP